MEKSTLNWRCKDISGYKNGTLTVKNPTNTRSKNGSIIWECECECGNKVYLTKQQIEKNPYCGKCNKTYNFIDFKDKQIGVLHVIEYVGDSKWLCECECGNRKIVHRSVLQKGATYACSCKRKLHKSDCNTTHGKSDTRLYHVWCGMKNRCYNKNLDEYHRYGGRGITICPEWLGEHGFENFSEWAYSTGYNENAKRGECTIDRIDNDGNYEPSNCRWATYIEQANNRSDNHLIEINGVVKGIKDWCAEYGIKIGTYKTRVRRGMDDVSAITTPIRKFSKDLTEKEKRQRKQKRLDRIKKWQEENKDKVKEYQRKSEEKKRAKNKTN